MPNLFPHGWAATPERLVLAVAITVAFALVARSLRGVNRSGMFAGGIASFCLFAGAGVGAFLSLVSLFTVTWIATRMGLRRKQELGLAERGDGRNATQVLANLAVAALAALIFARSGNRVWLLALTAALAEAAADTVASEVGQSFGSNARLITTFKPVLAGTDGGITSWGTIAGALAAVVTAVVAASGGVILTDQLWIAAFAGFAGMLADSLLGATLQRRGWISNEGVNLLGTLSAAALSYAAVAYWLP